MLPTQTRGQELCASAVIGAVIGLVVWAVGAFIGRLFGFGTATGMLGAGISMVAALVLGLIAGAVGSRPDVSTVVCCASAGVIAGTILWHGFGLRTASIMGAAIAACLYSGAYLGFYIERWRDYRTYRQLAR